jgi:hypothetical protein
VYLSAWQQERYQEVVAYHWDQLYRSRYLYGETSLWLPLAASPLDKWRLDETEGYLRELLSSVSLRAHGLARARVKLTLSLAQIESNAAEVAKE